MFNKNFYPTPRELASKMLSKYSSWSFRNAYILEPSAGKGDLLDAIKSKFTDNAKVHAIEIEPELQATIRGKGYDLIDEDFLQHQPRYMYQLIIANPPFDTGDKHLLKAWEVIGDGGHICFLLNAETLRNQYTESRQRVAALISRFGSVEFLEAPFANAQRKTNVDIALVYLQKPSGKNGNLNFDFEGMSEANKAQDEDFGLGDHTELVTPSKIKNAVHWFNESVQAARQMMYAYAKFQYNLKGCTNYIKDGEKEFMQQIQRLNTEGYNAAISMIRRSAWDGIFDQLNLREKLTSDVLKSFQKHQQEQAELEFTQDNIEQFIRLVLQNSGLIMQKCIEDSFDWLTMYDKKNRAEWVKEGWATNSHYKVNKKVIIPYFKVNNYGGFYSPSTSLDHMYKTEDLDKSLCFLSGKKYSEVVTVKEVVYDGYHNKKFSLGDDFETEFFMGKSYLKGTVHLTFKDQALLDKFNIAAAQHKKWIK